MADIYNTTTGKFNYDGFTSDTGGTLSRGFLLQRQGRVPVSDSEVFPSIAALQLYCQNGQAYPGQVVSIANNPTLKYTNAVASEIGVYMITYNTSTKTYGYQKLGEGGGDTSKLKSDVQKLQVTVSSTITPELSSLNASIGSTITPRLNSVESTISAMKTTISAMQTTISAMQATISAAETNINIIKTTVAAVQNSHNNLNNKFNELNKNLNTVLNTNFGSCWRIITE